MSGNLPPDQGRAHGLYDEQLQRQQQEKLLARASAESGGRDKPLFFSRAGERPA